MQTFVTSICMNDFKAYFICKKFKRYKLWISNSNHINTLSARGRGIRTEWEGRKSGVFIKKIKQVPIKTPCGLRSENPGSNLSVGD
ncbi:hypothetical protein Hdeb2414_s0653g00930021 [Helianthus debilis subsp. tardiflorus]